MTHKNSADRFSGLKKSANITPGEGNNALIQNSRSDMDVLPDLISRLNIDFKLSENDFSRIPARGKLILISNHPFGIYESLIIMDFLRKIRPDFKLLSSESLENIPEFSDYILFNHSLGLKKEYAANNLTIMNLAREWLENNGLLVIFPAEEIAILPASDRKWNLNIARLIRQTGAPVLPVHFYGRKGLIYQLLGLINTGQQISALPKFPFSQSQKKIPVSVGEVITSKEISHFESDQSLTNYIRMRTFILGNRKKRKTSVFGFGPKNSETVIDNEPLIEAISPEVLLSEINSLPEDRLLVKSDEWAVYYGKFDEFPEMMREIGRLREQTFRQVKEGTGKPLDLDSFDKYYIQLFIWNHKDNELVGAYRLGEVDFILEKFGKTGLYTSTLFKYKSRFFKKVIPSLELGRSFIQQKYQKNYSSLLMLWKGIGAFIVRHPKYRYLFGPVSINKEFKIQSRQILIDFLTFNRFEKNLAKLVKAENEHKKARVKGWTGKKLRKEILNIEDLLGFIRSIEEQELDIPVLLKQYLKLGGKLVGFNIDPDFSDVLDGLILVDLFKTDPALLTRYFTKEGLASYYSYNMLEYSL